MHQLILDNEKMHTFNQCFTTFSCAFIKWTVSYWSCKVRVKACGFSKVCNEEEHMAVFTGLQWVLFFFNIFNAFLDSVSYLSVYNSLWATMSSLCCKNWETWGYQRWSERTQEWRKREQNHREMQMLRRRRWLLVTSQSIRVTVPLKITQHQLFCSILHSRDRRWCYTPKKVSQIRVEVTHPRVPTP